jgi:hypothetical protein
VRTARTRRAKQMAMSKATLSIWVLTVVAVLTVGLGVASGKVGVVATESATENGVKQTSAVVPTSSVAHRPSALFIGDSYTRGPAYLADYGYACMVATNMGWDCNLAAESSTGYIAGGEGNRLAYVAGLTSGQSSSIAERIPRFRELDNADVVVLDAGRSDLSFGREDLGNVFLYTVRRAREAWPNAKLVVIAPWFVKQPVLEFPGYPGETVGQYLEGILRQTPELDSVTFIDPARLGWFVGINPDPYMTSDGVHPNEIGHKLISQYLTTDLMRLGFAGPS